MKCTKCNADIEQDAQFCPYCGNAVNHGRQCVKCGEHLDDDSDFCPYCGAKQNEDNAESQQLQENTLPHDEPIHKSDRGSISDEELEDVSQSGEVKKDSKRNLWIIIAIIGLFCIIGGYFAFSPSNNSTTINDAEDSENMDNEIFQRVTSIYNDVFNEQRSGDSDEKYCSKSYKALVKEFSEAYENSTIDGILGPELDHWTVAPEVSKPTMKIINITKKSNTDAVAKIHIDFGYDDNKEDDYSGTDVELKLVFENGDWYIDDYIIGDISERQEYLDGIKVCKENVSKVNKKNIGNCYVINGVKYLSYSQMKFIAQNELTKDEIDRFVSLCEIPIKIEDNKSSYSTSHYGNDIYNFSIVFLNRSNSTEFIRYSFIITANNDYIEKLQEEVEKEKYVEKGESSTTGYIDDYWFANINIDIKNLTFQRFQSKKLDLSEFQQ